MNGKSHEDKNRRPAGQHGSSFKHTEDHRPLDTPEMRPDGFYGPLVHRHRTNADLRRKAVTKQSPRKRFWRSR